ncbi:alpha/beta-hydrolase [Corynespora cassiicola Philippines]|uniref:Alpha/beta-hydrolase n=1 Tax=Corynespora cassiicola Philippines TaxID=1448308 RepID=A0A2T2NUW1_CORCC|nr:alpha/beta-hydrolase [Corynespora cassiicola Philippines]
MAATKPILVLVPGSFSQLNSYTKAIDPFRAKGYELEAVTLPTTGKKPGPLPTMYDDAAQIAGVVERLADEGKDIVLVGHSYGGIPVSQSIKGLSKQDRVKQGKKGGLVRVAYLTALVPDVGQAAQNVLTNDGEQYIAVDEDGWMLHNNLALTASVVFNDLSPEEGLEWVGRFVQHSSVSFANELTYPGYNDLPVSYLFCENDLCVTPAVQQQGIDVIEAKGNKKVDVTRIPTDHVPVASAPDKVIDWFVALIEKGGE